MIVLDHDQGSTEWIEARLGIPTASEFSRIITPTGKLSASRDTYEGELLAEWALGRPVTEFGGNDWTERGKALEPDARACYAFHADCEPQTVGFTLRDEDRMCGASPDALVGEHGLLELKCPGAGKHLLYLAREELPRAYAAQVQGQIWITGREWCDFMSYYPGLPALILRIAPDDRFQAALDKFMPEFLEELLAGRERLRSLGVVPAAEAEALAKKTREQAAGDEDLWLTDADVEEFLEHKGEN